MARLGRLSLWGEWSEAVVLGNDEHRHDGIAVAGAEVVVGEFLGDSGGLGRHPGGERPVKRVTGAVVAEKVASVKVQPYYRLLY